MVSAPELHLQAFIDLSHQDRALIQRLSARNLRVVRARSDVVREGERPRGAGLVLEGWACRYKQLPNGRTQILHFFVPGDFFNANAFILEAMDHSIAAITRLVHAEISPADLGEATSQSPRLARALSLDSLVDAAMAREWIANIGQRNAYERIAHLFCEMFVRLEAVGLTDDHRCDWPLTQNDLADATGLTPVHVNRTLQELRSQGLIALHGRQLAIPDLAALKQAAMFNPNYLHLERQAGRRAAA